MVSIVPESFETSSPGQPIRPVADPGAANSLIPAFRQHIVTIVALPSDARSGYVAWKITSALNG
jgi:hypothetical protein